MTRLLSLCLLAIPLSLRAADEGVLPVGKDGQPLNLDFETGTLQDWSAEGDAFKDQPIKGDTVAARRGDMKSRHQGQYWIGGYEKFGDKPTGTLMELSAVLAAHKPGDKVKLTWKRGDKTMTAEVTLGGRGGGGGYGNTRQTRV